MASQAFEEEFLFRPFTPELKVFDLVDVKMEAIDQTLPPPLPIHGLRVVGES